MTLGERARPADTVDGEDEPARTDDTDELVHGRFLATRLEVLDHGDGGGEVEGVVGELQPRDVHRPVLARAAPARLGQHRLAPVDAEDFCAARGEQARPAARAAAHVESAPAGERTDRVEQCADRAPLRPVRVAIQRRRRARVADGVHLGRRGGPAALLPVLDQGIAGRRRWLGHGASLEPPMAPTGTRRRVLVYANEVVGSRMAGPGIRSYNFARELAHAFDVTLAVPAEPDLELPGVRIAVAPPRDARAATALVQEHDAVVAQRLPPHTMLAAARSATRVVYDLYAPVLLEDLAHGNSRRRCRRSSFASASSSSSASSCSPATRSCARANASATSISAHCPPQAD